MLRLAYGGLGSFPCPFGGTTVVSCPPHCFFNLQTSKLFLSGD